MPVSLFFLLVVMLCRCGSAFGEGRDATTQGRYVPRQSACLLVDDPGTPEKETELYIVTLPMSLLSEDIARACLVEKELPKVLHDKWMECEKRICPEPVPPPPPKRTHPIVWVGVGVALVAAFWAGAKADGWAEKVLP